MKRHVIVALVTMAAVVGAFAEDNTTTTINGFIQDNGGATYYVGMAGTNNTLLITNAGIFTNVSAAYIGNNLGANENMASVVGQESAWYINNGLDIGAWGSGNTLTVADNGSVYNSIGTIGAGSFDDPSISSNNTVIITGIGSVWSNSNYLTVGMYGAVNNTLTITNGGTVYDSSAVIGASTDARNNAVTVTGEGSTWNNSSDLYVGAPGAGNQLTISAGGSVKNASGYIGAYLAASSNNIVLVTDTGSIWSNSASLYVGHTGSGNQLTIANSGTVYNASGYIGNDSFASNNAVLVTGRGSLWKTFGEGAYVGYSGSANTLTISAGGRVDGLDSIGYTNTANNNLVLVTGAGSVLTNTGLAVGVYGSGNGLVVSNGGTVYTGDIGVGVYDSQSNYIYASGTDTRVYANGYLSVGRHTGGNNSMLIQDGALVQSMAGYVGEDYSSNNLVVVSGAGSGWTNTGAYFYYPEFGFTNYNKGWLGVGFQAADNKLIITNSGSVYDDGGMIGGPYAGASNCSVLVTGTGSLWQHKDNVIVGFSNPGSRLDIQNGGTVQAFTNATIGANDGSSNNVLAIAGGNLIVTNAGGSATLDVRRGSLILDSGLVRANALLATNGAQSGISFNGGTMSLGGAEIANGAAFTVGNGTNTAVYNMLGGVHIIQGGLIISSNATLAGSGSITGAVTFLDGGILTPGNSAGTQTVSSLTLSSLSILDFELGATNGPSDFVHVLGDLTLDGTLNVPPLLGFGVGTYTLITYEGVLTNNTLNVGAMPAGYSGNLDLSTPGQISLSVIPEPGTIVLTGLGLSVLLIHRIRKKHG